MKTKLLLAILLISSIAFSQTWNQVYTKQNVNFATTISKGSELYVAYTDDTNNNPFIEKYNGTNWTAFNSGNAISQESINKNIVLSTGLSIQNKIHLGYLNSAKSKMQWYESDNGGSFALKNTANSLTSTYADYGLNMFIQLTGTISPGNYYYSAFIGTKQTNVNKNRLGGRRFSGNDGVSNGSYQFDLLSYTAEIEFDYVKQDQAFIYQRNTGGQNFFGRDDDSTLQGYGGETTSAPIYTKIAGIVDETKFAAYDTTNSMVRVCLTPNGSATTTAAIFQYSVNATNDILKFKKYGNDFYLLYSDANNKLQIDKYSAGTTTWSTLTDPNITTNTTNTYDMFYYDGNVHIMYTDANNQLVLNEYTQRNSTTIYVNQTAMGANDGTSWANAYTNLQPALDAAIIAEDQVWVASGTYMPTESPNGTSTGVTDRNNAFHFSNEIKVYGGFAGTEAVITERVSGNETILSGDLNDDDDTGGDNSENAYHVFITSGLTNNAILDGFTVTKGNSNGSNSTVYYLSKPFYDVRAGGIYNVNSSPTLNNLIIIKNEGTQGGGMYNEAASNPIVTNVIFSENIATADAGGMRNRDSSPTLINVVFSKNESGSYGGGLYNGDGSSSFTNVTFNGNTATTGGGGLISVNSATTFNNTVFYGNSPEAFMNYQNSSTSSGVNNASDEITSTVPGTTVTLTTTPFTNSTVPAGTDGLFGTADDGLIPAAGSGLIDEGNGTLNSEASDVLGNVREFGTIDIGAYEYGSSLLRVNPITIYVDQNATTGADDGTNWSDAYTDLQTALNAATTKGDQVWVAAGTYVPIESPNGTSTGLTDRNNAFYFNSDIELYGGFAGTEIAITDRVSGKETILSGDLNNDNNISNNAYHVLLTRGLTNNTIIDGFTITLGNAYGDGSNLTYDTAAFTNTRGGGMYNITSSPTITNVVFADNAATTAGGGLHNYTNSSPILTNVVFVNNTAGAGYGGGMYSYASSFITVTNATFVGNIAGAGRGSAIWNQSDGTNNSDSVINNSVFFNNTNEAVVNYQSVPTQTGSNNASDETTSTLVRTTVSIDTTITPFTNSSTPAGIDGVFGTLDDGLVPAVGSALIDAGSSTLSTETYDIVGNDRVLNNSIDIGAYEYDSTLSNKNPVLDNNSLMVYPNPVKSTVNITLATGKTLQSVQIFTLLGEKVVDANTSIVNLSTLTEGVYVLRVESKDGKVVIGKIIKE